MTGPEVAFAEVTTDVALLSALVVKISVLVLIAVQDAVDVVASVVLVRTPD